MPTLLQTEKLTIQFGGLAAVNEVDFQIDEGEVVGLIGPNGSGKTTFFNLLTGIYKPTKGRSSIEGRMWWVSPPLRSQRRALPEPFRTIDSSSI